MHDDIDGVLTHERLGLREGMHVDGLEIARAHGKTRGAARRRRIFSQDHRRGDAIHIERHTVTDDKDERERQHHSHEDTAVVAQELGELLARERTQTAQESRKTVHVFAPSSRDCSTIAIKISFISASGRCIRRRISDGRPSTSSSP